MIDSLFDKNKTIFNLVIKYSKSKHTNTLKGNKLT